MAHTQGPWTQVDFVEVRSPDGQTVAWCPAMADAVDGATEAADNARLIAAAPDLLQAAKDASQMLHALASVANQMPPKYFAMVHAAMPQGYGDLDAAIAKAQGGA